MKQYALIAAGGSGTRFGKEVPKQFRELNGKPMLMYCIEAFHRCSSFISIGVVLPEPYLDFWKGLCKKHHFLLPHRVAAGGKDRIGSVRNGLALFPDESEALVAVHDGARPLVDEELIRRLFQEAEKHGNAVPYIEPVDSVRLQMPGGEVCPVERNHVKLIQTPQVFDLLFLKKAYADIKDSIGFTDDAGVAEHEGASIHLTEGARENIKITFREDLLWAETFLSARNLLTHKGK